MSKAINLRMFGPLVYWCEGTKSIRQNRGNPVQIEFVSSDPLLIKLFVEFLRSTLKVKENKLRGRLQIHGVNNKEKAEKYWSKISGIPISQFQKPIIKKTNIVHRFNYNILEYGTFIVRYGSKEKYNELIQMITDLKRNLLEI